MPVMNLPTVVDWMGLPVMDWWTLLLVLLTFFGHCDRTCVLTLYYWWDCLFNLFPDIVGDDCYYGRTKMTIMTPTLLGWWLRLTYLPTNCGAVGPIPDWRIYIIIQFLLLLIPWLLLNLLFIVLLVVDIVVIVIAYLFLQVVMLLMTLVLTTYSVIHCWRVFCLFDWRKADDGDPLLLLPLVLYFTLLIIYQATFVIYRLLPGLWPLMTQADWPFPCCGITVLDCYYLLFGILFCEDDPGGDQWHDDDDTTHAATASDGVTDLLTYYSDGIVYSGIIGGGLLLWPGPVTFTLVWLLLLLLLFTLLTPDLITLTLLMNLVDINWYSINQAVNPITVTLPQLYICIYSHYYYVWYAYVYGSPLCM